MPAVERGAEMGGRRPVKRAMDEALKARRSVESLPADPDAARDEVRKAKAGIASRTAVATASPEMEALMPVLFAALSEGASVASVAKANGLSASELRRYAWRTHRDEYESAQKSAADALAERSVDAAAMRNETEERVETTYSDGSVVSAVKRFDNVQRSKVAAEQLWRMAASRDPSRYGTKAGGDDSASVMSEIIAARKRIGKGA